MRWGLITIFIIWCSLLILSALVLYINPFNNAGLEICVTVVLGLIIFGLVGSNGDAVSFALAIIFGCVVILCGSATFYGAYITKEAKVEVKMTESTLQIIVSEPQPVKLLSYQDTRALIQELNTAVDYCFKLKVELTTLALDKPITEVDGARLRDTILTCEKQRLQSKVNQIN